MKTLIEKALEQDKFSIARLITLFEDTRSETALQRAEAMKKIKASPLARSGIFLGFTGTPGAGKSSLIGEIAPRLIQTESKLSVAVLAVDPSSEVSGGALLGDRTRVRFPLSETRLFFRSQSSAGALGGISPTTFQVCRLLHYLFDFIIIETVGIGQNEIEIKNLADEVFLILQPMAGDQIQFMKAGIMEIPHAFVMNKCDETKAARQSYHALKASLAFVRPAENEIKILQTSVRTGFGLDDFVSELLSSRERSHSSLHEKEVHFFRQWVKEEYGRWGLQFLKEKMGGAAALMQITQSFDQAQIKFIHSFLNE
ncbi:MAG: protein kinase [Deltaproteobacteria bacterium]|nr:protein kinase [Deltaproteobacteria bacterium]